LIPNNIILTWKNKDIPTNILENIKNLNPDKEILFFTDEDVVDFLKTEYGNKFVDFFHSIKLGYNKGDFFRYCYLYKHGGYYCDIDIEHILPISNYIDENTKFFTVISGLLPGHIFQALLFTEQNNNIIASCIDDMFKYGANPPITKNYEGHTTTCMFNNIKTYLNANPQHGFYAGHDGGIGLGIELMHNGRYICVYNNAPIAFSRYINYSRESGFAI